MFFIHLEMETLNFKCYACQNRLGFYFKIKLESMAIHDYVLTQVYSTYSSGVTIES